MRGLVVLCFLLALGCQTRQRMGPPPSATKEAPDDANSPEALGISGPLKWDDIKNLTHGEAPPPWSDSYWPLEERGVARRWQMNKWPNPPLNAEPATLYQQLSEMEEAAGKKDKAALAYLSPAEKYDLLIGGERPIPPVLLTRLQVQEDRYRKDVGPKSEKLAEEFKVQSARLRQVFEKYREANRQRRELTVEKEKAMQAGNTSLARELDGKLVELAPALAKYDDERQKLIEELKSMQSTRRNLAKGYYEDTIALARDLKNFRPLLGDAWEVWAHYFTTYNNNWSWMGHCHGWAAASLLVERPRHAVLAKKDGLEILFTEGDLRGLITKLWSEQAPTESFFGARRCESRKPDLPTDRRGRILDGTICYGRKNGACTLENGKIIFVKNNLIESGTVMFSEKLHDDRAKIAIVQSDLGEDLYHMFVFANHNDFESWFQTGGQKGKYEEAVMHLTKGCRDTNPMTLHAALTRLVKGGTGIVVDKARTDQVWNQPVYKYDLEYLPIVLNGKTTGGRRLSPAGELAGIEDIKDPFRAYRAPGTAYLTQVKATLYYGLELGPFVSYAGVADKTDSMTVTYTLEWDKDKNLIGGEWGLIPTPGATDAKSSDNHNLISGDAPDFIWYYEKNAKVQRGLLDNAILKKLHACSLATPDGKQIIKTRHEETGQITDTELAYRTCEM